MEFKEKVVKLRKERGWSQAKLGEQIGIHVAHLSRLENGHSMPSVELLIKIARAFGVTMDFLMNQDAEDALPVSIKDRSLVERLELLDQLDETDRQTVIHVIDSMLTKKRMLDLLTKSQA